MQSEMDLERLGKLLQGLREAQGITQAEAARRLHVSPSSFNRIEKGKRPPSAALIDQLAGLYNVSADYLLDRSPTVPQIDAAQNATIEKDACNQFPIIGEVRAGFDGATAEESYTGQTLEVPTSWLRGLPPSEWFVLKAAGNSMWPEIVEGDLLLVRKTDEVNNGETAIVITPDGAGTVKRVEFAPGGGYIDLVPKNPEYEPKRISGEDMNRVLIQGRVDTVVRRRD